MLRTLKGYLLWGMMMRGMWFAGVCLMALLSGTAAASGPGASELALPPAMAKEKGRFELTARHDVFAIPNGPSQVQTRSFTPAGGELLVGPTMRVQAGDTLKLRFRNELTFSAAEGDEIMSDTLPHGFDVLNVHYHGLHVTPQGHGDNVLLNIYPAGSGKERMAACRHDTHHDVAHKHVCYEGEYDYEFKIPDNHPSGTYWYHPHKHGAVALHLGGGMAGALIVEDSKHGLESLPAVKAAQEKVIVLNEVVYRTDVAAGKPLPVDCLSNYGFMTSCVFTPDPPPAPQNPPPANQKLSVNGQFDATVSMTAGEAQLWRVVNATVGNTVPMCLVPMPGTTASAPELYVLGVDGTPLQRPVPMDGDLPFKLAPPVFDLGQTDASGAPLTSVNAQNAVNNELVLLTAGQRLDLMVKAPAQPGTYALLQPNPLAATSPTMDQLCQAPTEVSGADWTASLVMYVQVNAAPAGAAVNAAVPTQTALNKLTTPKDLVGAKDVPAGPTQGVVFGFTSGTFSPATGGASVVNARPFNAQRVQRTLKLDQMDLWSAQSANDTHMFHIHVNPFQITQRGTVPYAFPVWRDTALINCTPGSGCSFPGGLSKQSSSGSGEVVQFLSRPVEFTGAMVMHCHNVTHEDNGMMELVEIVK